MWNQYTNTWMDSRVPRVPLSGCTWGPAGCPGRSGESTQDRGPTPHRVLSGWYTAGHSRSGLSHLHWFLLPGYPRTGLLRSGHLYLLRQRESEMVRKRGDSIMYTVVKGVRGTDSVIFSADASGHISDNWKVYKLGGWRGPGQSNA